MCLPSKKPLRFPISQRQIGKMNQERPTESFQSMDQGFWILLAPMTISKDTVLVAHTSFGPASETENANCAPRAGVLRNIHGGERTSRAGPRPPFSHIVLVIIVVCIVLRPRRGWAASAELLSHRLYAEHLHTMAQDGSRWLMNGS